jgi:hypothetical protein
VFQVTPPVPTGPRGMLTPPRRRCTASGSKSLRVDARLIRDFPQALACQAPRVADGRARRTSPHIPSCAWGRPRRPENRNPTSWIMCSPLSLDAWWRETERIPGYDGCVPSRVQTSRGRALVICDARQWPARRSWGRSTCGTRSPTVGHGRGRGSTGRGGGVRDLVRTVCERDRICRRGATASRVL